MSDEEISREDNPPTVLASERNFLSNLEKAKIRKQYCV